MSRTLLWSLIAAAFIGPGTVTTAARAGSEGGYRYLLFVVLVAAAGFLLMEMVARLTLVTNRSFGQVLGRRGRWLGYFFFGAVLLGCMAYQSGNLLGALAGVDLVIPRRREWVLAVAGMAALVLWPGESRKIARALAVVVALMGVVFVAVAIGLVVGDEPLDGRGQLTAATVVGLVGTTIVPYNFFLAAGLGRGERLVDMRRGLLVSFAVGALITGGIVLVGSLTAEFDKFTDLARTLDARLWDKGAVLLGIGLFAAGFSSAVTAPLAAGVAARELLGRGKDDAFGPRSIAFRLVWLLVLAAGTLVALTGLDVITVILAAQIANGILVPFVAALVLMLANDRGLLGERINAAWQNLAGLLVASVLAQKNAELLYNLAGGEGASFSYAVAAVYVLLVGYGMYTIRRRSATDVK